MDSELCPMATRLVNLIFCTMALTCRGFDPHFDDDDRLNAEKTMWIKTFERMKIKDMSQINAGLNMLQEKYKYPIPPQIAVFLDWIAIKPKDIGLPSEEQAYTMSQKMNQQFSEYKPSCQKVYTVISHVLKQIDPHIYRQMNYQSSKKIFSHAYAVACQQFIDGELKEIPKSLSEKPEYHPSDKQRNDDARKKCMEDLAAIGIVFGKT